MKTILKKSSVVNKKRAGALQIFSIFRETQIKSENLKKKHYRRTFLLFFFNETKTAFWRF